MTTGKVSPAKTKTKATGSRGKGAAAKNESGRIKELKSLALKQGFVTQDQLDQFISVEAAGEDLVAEMEEAYHTLGDMKIEVFESEEEALLKMRKAKKKAEVKVSDPKSSAGVTPVRYDDPVRMYLREMGKVPLLDREGEVTIAKRIEEAEHRILFALFRTANSIKELQGMAARLAKDKVKLDEFVHVEFGQPGENEAAGKKQRIKVLAGVKKVVALQAEVGKMRKMSVRSLSVRARTTHLEKLALREKKLAEELVGLAARHRSLAVRRMPGVAPMR